MSDCTSDDLSNLRDHLIKDGFFDETKANRVDPHITIAKAFLAKI